MSIPLPEVAAKLALVNELNHGADPMDLNPEIVALWAAVNAAPIFARALIEHRANWVGSNRAPDPTVDAEVFHFRCRYCGTPWTDTIYSPSEEGAWAPPKTSTETHKPDCPVTLARTIFPSG